MKLQELALLTDENIAYPVIEFLRAQGFDVVDVAALGLLGKSDKEVLAVAHGQNRLVVTQDSDFGTLTLAARQPFTGIIYLKPGHIRPEFTIESLRAVLTHVTDVAIPFLIIVQHTDAGIRIRYRPIQPVG